MGAWVRDAGWRAMPESAGWHVGGSRPSAGRSQLGRGTGPVRERKGRAGKGRSGSGLGRQGEEVGRCGREEEEEWAGWGWAWVF